ncbi:hypothetical protein Taro_021156 [Colocasia esculenta]|uniref:Uncharacterized protein n=1 Tax=Colocasia esculenta TaxID=4460 RepID=A0A843V4I3_COLES|nr:hypothetical protein [Colocasia esculenta]
MEVLRPIPKQPLRILLTKGIVPLKDNTTPSTPTGLLLFPGQEGSPLLLQDKEDFAKLAVDVVMRLKEEIVSVGVGESQVHRDLLGLFASSMASKECSSSMDPMTGKKVKLLDLDNEQLAEGIVMSVDPKKFVMGRPIGHVYCEVLMDEAKRSLFNEVPRVLKTPRVSIPYVNWDLAQSLKSSLRYPWPLRIFYLRQSRSWRLESF